MSHQRSGANSKWRLPDGNKLEPLEGARFLGIENMCRVVMGGTPLPPFDSESAKLSEMKKLVWSAKGDSGSKRNNTQTDLEEVLRQAELFPNVTGAILDDFFWHHFDPKEAWAVYPLEMTREMRKRLHEAKPRSLDFWVVWYKQQLEFKIDDYLREFDVITYWNMRTPAEKKEFPNDWARVVERTPGKRRMNGCYIWNYGEGKPLTIEDIKFECETFHQLIKKGDSEGIIFCANCCADVGGPAIEWLKGWIKEVGEETV